MSANKTDWSEPNPHFPDIKLGVGYIMDSTSRGDYEKYYQEPLSKSYFKRANGNNLPIGAFNDSNYY